MKILELKNKITQIRSFVGGLHKWLDKGEKRVSGGKPHKGQKK